MLPAVSVAREDRTWLPGGASQSNCQPIQAASPSGSPSRASAKLDPPWNLKGYANNAVERIAVVGG